MVRKSIQQIRAEDAARRAKFAREEAARQKAVKAAQAQRQARLAGEKIPTGSQARITETVFLPEIETLVTGGPSKAALAQARARQGQRGTRTVQTTASRRGRQTTTTTIRQVPVQKTKDLRISEIGRRFGPDAAVRELRFRFKEADSIKNATDRSNKKKKLQRQADFFGFKLGGKGLARPKAPAARVIRVGAQASKKTRRLVRTGSARIATTAIKRGGGRKAAQKRRRTKKKRSGTRRRTTRSFF